MHGAAQGTRRLEPLTSLRGAGVEPRVASARLVSAMLASALLVAALLSACSNDSAPRDPAAYSTEPIDITTDDGVWLRGELLIPHTPQHATHAIGAAVIVGGTGVQDRNGSRPDLPGYQLLRDVAVVAAEAGVYSLRFDERGAGESGGTPGAVTTRTAADVATAVRYLHTRFPDREVAVIGHSEGGLVAMIAAASDSVVHALALLGTPSRPGREIARAQRELIASGNSTLYPPALKDEALKNAEAAAEYQAQNDPWLREWFALEPMEYAAKQRGRALIVHGERDMQVPVLQADELSEGLKAAGVQVTEVKIPGMNHLFLSDTDGHPDHYVLLHTRTLDTRAALVLRSWLRESAPSGTSSKTADGSR